MDQSGYTDEELIGRIRSGDPRAEEELYTRHKKTVLSCARKYYIEGADWDDLLQEGMIGLYKAVCGFDPDREAKFRSFAEVCIRRQIYTAIKGALRKKHRLLNHYVSLNGDAYEEGSESPLLGTIRTRETTDPEDIFIETENDRDFAERIRRVLSPLERKCLSLYLDGESYDSIAEKLGKNRKSADNAIQRIRKKITVLLNDKER